MAAQITAEDMQKHFAALAELEKDFEKTELEILRETTIKQAPLFERRNTITSNIPGFWAQVLDEAAAPLQLDEHFHPEDSPAISALKTLNVTRPNVESGDPRDLEFTFVFEDNDYMPAQTLVKKFTYEESGVPGGSNLISEPVEVKFKPGKDITAGVSKAAIEAFEERKAKKDKKGAEKKNVGEKEKKLAQCVNKATSFFCWFSYTGAHKALGEVANGDEEEEEEEDDDEDEEGLFSPVEAFHYGDEVALTLAEDLFPNAVKYFTSSLEPDSDSDDELEIDLEDDSEEEESLAKLLATTEKAKGEKKKSKRNGEESDLPAKKKAKK